MKHPDKEEIVWKEFIDLRHSKNEKSRQNLRKVISRSSRFLDNYFNPGMHEKSWYPNGQKIDKRKYEHCQTGLCHFYERGQVLQKLDIETKLKKRAEEKKFLEFDFMQKNDIVITIEHCSNCDDHNSHTQHINDIYRYFAQTLQKCVIMRFPFIKVYLKPIDTEIVPVNLQNYEKNLNVDLKYKDVRIGAFEIQLAIKLEKLEIIQIHSKLSTGLWPSLSSVLNKIVSKLPRFNLSTSIFDKEDKIEPEEKENLQVQENEKILKKDEENLLPSKFENIKINLFQLKNPQIIQLINSANEELDTILNPKKRIILLSQTRLKLKEIYGDNNDKELLSTNLINSVRPMTSRSILTNKNDTNNSNYFSHRLTSASTTRPTSVGANIRVKSPTENNFRSSSNSKFNNSMGFNINSKSDLIIEDKNILENIKGSLIRTVYTNREGRHILDNLPHDTYLIEIENSKNFIGCGMIFKTNFIIESMKNNSSQVNGDNPNNNLGTASKLIGLKRQVDSYVSIYTSFTKDPESYDFTPVKNCMIILRKLNDSQSETFMEEGRYEIITVPGRYIIEIYKAGYDFVRKEILLISGENNINIDLILEKKYYLNINIINYETEALIDKAMINVTYSKSDNISQGLSDKNGVYQLLASQNEDFLSISVNKEGFFPTQRTYVREIFNSNVTSTGNKDTQKMEKTWKTESESINRTLYVYLVREAFVVENSLMIFFTYSNTFEQNFLPCLIETENPDKDLKNFIITHDDRQKTHGIMITMVRYEKKVSSQSRDNISNKEKTEDLGDLAQEEFPEIVRFMLKIENKEFFNYYEIYHKNLFNGLQKFCCEINIYTPENKFYVTPPQYSRDTEFNFWDIGFIDLKNMLFYEMSLLVNNLIPRILFFNEWINFLQFILDSKLTSKLFESFQFNKGILISNDRLLYDAAFVKSIKILFKDSFDRDFTLYLSDIAKNNYKMVSYTKFKKLITSNLKNFKNY